MSKCKTLGTHQYFNLTDPDVCCFACGEIPDLSSNEADNPIANLYRNRYKENILYKNLKYALKYYFLFKKQITLKDTETYAR